MTHRLLETGRLSEAGILFSRSVYKLDSSYIEERSDEPIRKLETLPREQVLRRPTAGERV